MTSTPAAAARETDAVAAFYPRSAPVRRSLREFFDTNTVTAGFTLFSEIRAALPLSVLAEN